MLGDAARHSVSIATPNADGSWASTKCWHFTSGNYIKHTLADGTLHYPGANNMTIAFWWKKPILSGSHGFTGSCIPVGLKSGNKTVIGLVGHEAFDGGIQNMYVRIPRNSGAGYSTMSMGSSPYYSSIYNDDCSSGSDLWDGWVFTTLSYTHSGATTNNIFLDNACYDNLGPVFLGNNSYLINYLNQDNNVQIGGNHSFYIRELGIWHTVLDESNKTALYNNGSPIDFKTDVGNYNQSSSLKAYWRFGDGTGDNPANHLNDEEDDATTINMDLTGVDSFYGTINQVPVSSVGGS